MECEHRAAPIMQLIGVTEGTVFLPGFDDDEVDGSSHIYTYFVFIFPSTYSCVNCMSLVQIKNTYIHMFG